MARLVRRGADGDFEATAELHFRLLIPEDREVVVFDEETGGDQKRRAGDVYSPSERFVDADQRTILMCAHERWVAEPLSEGIADVPACVHDRAFMGDSVPPGTLRIGIRADSLASVCYLSVALALALADKMPVAFCADPACRRPFFPADKRQRFCSRTCGNRVRFQRFTDRHRTATTSQEGNLRMATRRGRGEGSITKRSDGRWMAQADLGWQNAKRRRKALYGRTKREVLEKLRETLHRKEHGLSPVPERETVGTFLRRWLEIRQGHVRSRTRERYTSRSSAHTCCPPWPVSGLPDSRRRT